MFDIQGFLAKTGQQGSIVLLLRFNPQGIFKLLRCTAEITDLDEILCSCLVHFAYVSDQSLSLREDIPEFMVLGPVRSVIFKNTRRFGIFS